MKKSIFSFVILLAGALNLFAQETGCVTTRTDITGTASITFVRYPHKELTGGAFSVSATKQVRFASGNLQYRASTNVWRFALNQWDMIGSGNTNVSSTYDGWIDLFGWGCSGWDGSGATVYQPWSTSDNNGDYYANSLTETEADWAYHNQIVNGGDESGPAAYKWRVLTQTEWGYLLGLNSGSNRTDARELCAMGTLMNVKGLYILPDNWDWASIASSLLSAEGFLWTPISSSVSCSNNVISMSANGEALWEAMESNGAVFLPLARARYGTSIERNDYGFYWSTTTARTTTAYAVDCRDGVSVTISTPSKYKGYSVRPVQDIH